MTSTPFSTLPLQSIIPTVPPVPAIQTGTVPSSVGQISGQPLQPLSITASEIDRMSSATLTNTPQPPLTTRQTYPSSPRQPPTTRSASTIQSSPRQPPTTRSVSTIQPPSTLTSETVTPTVQPPITLTSSTSQQTVINPPINPTGRQPPTTRRASTVQPSPRQTQQPPVRPQSPRRTTSEINIESPVRPQSPRRPTSETTMEQPPVRPQSPRRPTSETTIEQPPSRPQSPRRTTSETRIEPQVRRTASETMMEQPPVRPQSPRRTTRIEPPVRRNTSDMTMEPPITRQQSPRPQGVMRQQSPRPQGVMRQQSPRPQGITRQQSPRTQVVARSPRERVQATPRRFGGKIEIPITSTILNRIDSTALDTLKQISEEEAGNNTSISSDTPITASQQVMLKLQKIDPTKLKAGRAKKEDDSYTIQELKDFAKDLKLRVSGTKKELVERIRSALKLPPL